MTGFLDNIERLTLDNNHFRRVLYTGRHSQLVVMTLQPKEEIGLEVHEHEDQFFRVEAGTGQVVMNGEARSIQDDDAFIVPAGTEHNVINSSDSQPLQLYTIYSPPHHPDGTIHQTKAEAEAAEEH